jgi:hypothetical protein
LIYLEFIERDRFMPIEVFRYLGDQQSSWAEGQVDRMVLQLGRTLRLGPSPSYLAFWQIPDLTRADAWEAYFDSDAALRNRRGAAMHRAVHIQRAGFYDELVTATPRAEGFHYIEYFEADGSGEDLESAFKARANAHSEATLTFVLQRIGFLGPDPPHLAVWHLRTFSAIEGLARGAPAHAPVRVCAAGVYRPLGSETL